MLQESKEELHWPTIGNTYTAGFHLPQHYMVKRDENAKGTMDRATPDSTLSDTTKYKVEETDAMALKTDYIYT